MPTAILDPAEAALSPSGTTTVEPLPTRRFGKTEERVPMLGLGTGPGGIGMQDRDAIPLYHAAIDRGITYLDTAPGYNRAHVQLGEIMPARRDEVFLVTKAFAPTAKEVIEIHEQSLKDLKVDHVDLLYSHCIGSHEPEVLLAPDGAFAGLQELKRRGLTRYIGFTQHHYTVRAEKLLAEIEIDAVMLAMNYIDRHTYGFEDRILPVAHRLDLGIACMKVYGGAKDMDYEKNHHSHLGRRNHHAAFRYALGLPGVAVAVIGMFTVEEIERNIAWARAWEPLTGEERERVDREGAEVAREWGPHFGETG
jgi:aryl-alcohol dehydrogenase-like predicted oxidoreductase